METANEKLLFHALGEFGRREIAGKDSDPVVLSWIRRYFKGADDDSKVAWCGLFMAEMAKRACAEIPELPGMARNWMKVGQDTTRPIQGDVVIFKRGPIDSWKGHVGLFCRWDEGLIWTLGGNQSNQVNIKAYRAADLLGFRRLSIIEDENTDLLG